MEFKEMTRNISVVQAFPAFFLKNNIKIIMMNNKNLILI